MEWLHMMGYGVGALIVTAVIANKFGFVKLKKYLKKSIGIVRYAREKLVAADAYLVDIYEAAKDDNISRQELKILIERGGKFAKELQDTTVISDAIHELDGDDKLPV